MLVGIDVVIMVCYYIVICDDVGVRLIWFSVEFMLVGLCIFIDKFSGYDDIDVIVELILMMWLLFMIVVENVGDIMYMVGVWYCVWLWGVIVGKSKFDVIDVEVFICVSEVFDLMLLILLMFV